MTTALTQVLTNTPLNVLKGAPSLGGVGQVERFGLSMWFKVEVAERGNEKKSLGEWSGCSGLGVNFGQDKVWSGGEYDAPYYVPTSIEYPQLTLERAMKVGDSGSVRVWLEDVARRWIGGMDGGAALIDPSANATGFQGNAVTITLYTSLAGDSDAARSENAVDVWVLKNAVPVSWSGPTLSSKSSDVAIERLVLAHRGFLQAGSPTPASTGPAAAATAGQGKLKLAYHPKAGTPEELVFQYSPTRLNLDRTASRQDGKLLEVKNSQDSFREDDKLNISFSDLQIEGATAIKSKVDLLWAWMEAAGKTQTKEGTVFEPKILSLTMGSGNGWLLNKKAQLKQVRVSYTRFASTGVPTRALVTLTFVVQPEKTPWKPAQNPGSRGDAGNSAHVLTGQENLPQLATSTQGDPNAWRGIAKDNNVDDPLRLRPGTRVGLLPGARR
ncbi:phage tail protein [Amycolatopsis sp. cmx-4-61]|uniref:phage tail protein n=1 Tax=Amycolatopsis sp. cmx-4-61 TaxID=2790937 RepID=UPI00397A3D35